MATLTHRLTTNHFAAPQEVKGGSRRRWLAESFNRGAQTLDEATESARSMAASLERKGLLMRAPARR